MKPTVSTNSAQATTGRTNAGQSNTTDIWSKMYPSLKEATDAANNNWAQQPYFMCEYAHAMGNAMGNFQEYWDIIESSRYGIGGLVWGGGEQGPPSPPGIHSGDP